MKTSDLISMSIRSLWRRKLRTSLTILGVVIGASSIILMLSLGLAMEKNMEDQFASWGDLTLIDVYSYGRGDSGDAPQLDDEAILQIEQVANVERVIPSLRTDAYVTFGKFRSVWSMQVYALEAEDLEALGYKVVEGRDLLAGEDRFVVMGKNVLATTYMNKIGKKFDWDNVDWSNMEAMPIDLESDKITLEVAQFDQRGKPYIEGQDGKIKAPKGIDVRVVGLFSGDDWSVAENIFVSRAVYNELVAGKKEYEKKLGWYQEEEDKKDKNQKVTYEQLRVKVNHRDNVVTALEAIKALGYTNVNSNMEYIEQAKQQSNGKRMALGGIGIVSFFVAAIGIANTMMMSIYERTREIGVMKVIGAKLVDIKRLFLIEALLIGAIGGIVGSIFSYGLSMAMNAIGEPIAQLLDMYGATVVSIVPIWLMLAAIAFSTIVGLVSGYFPAKKAMKLSALTAIKTE